MTYLLYNDGKPKKFKFELIDIELTVIRYTWHTIVYFNIIPYSFRKKR